MVFTTQLFLFIFMPISVCLYFLMKQNDWVLILLSLAFYSWACTYDVFLFALYIVCIYGLGHFVHAYKKKGIGIAIVLAACMLVYFKYTGFFIETSNRFLQTQMSVPTIIAPLGISFITFSAISYLMDIYHEKAGYQSMKDCFLYLSFFPKVVSGPIVLWKDFHPQIQKRFVCLDQSVEGLNRIMIGFAKKLILADTFGLCLARMGARPIDQMTAFLSLIAYMLQIYYDFSGYSDIALGLARIFGFKFKENFQFPYRSLSISEFWRRWHISLGTWFREYVYFTLGGSRCSKTQTMCNLAVVFLLTGIWHGAGWNYILWGCINGFFVVMEHRFPIYEKVPKPIRYMFTMGVVMCFWQLFRFSSIRSALHTILLAFGMQSVQNVYYTWSYYFDAQILTLMAIGIVGATLLGSPKLKALYQREVQKPVVYFVQEIGLLLLFVVAILCMVSSTYSPFIYFQY